MSEAFEPAAVRMQRQPAAGLLDALSAIRFSRWWRSAQASRNSSAAGSGSPLILAFFVEPLMERLRSFGPHAHPHAGRGVLFTAAVGLAFAFAAVCLNDAMKALLAAHDEHAAPRSGLMGGLSLTVGWVMVPFTTNLAWFSARRPWLAAPMGLVAALSTCAAGWLFGWSNADIVTTMIPCLIILLLGYPRTCLRRARPTCAPGKPGLRRGLLECGSPRRLFWA